MSSPYPNDTIGLYVHVPFCLTKCGYCSFFSVEPHSDKVERYLEALKRETLHRLSPEVGRRVRTVFVGGGNPSSIGPVALRRLLDILQACLAQARIEEWTVETNPETLSTETAGLLKPLPHLRLSMGIQRLCDDELEFLGRNTSLSKAFQALDIAGNTTSNVGVDFILGVPGLPSLGNHLAAFLDRFPVRHVSAYFLSAEEGTPLMDSVRSGSVGDPAEVGPEELFEIRSLLGNRGFQHYEVSNFALPGSECLHNLNYWHNGDFIGLGPAAVGTVQGRRFTNPSSLDSYFQGLPSMVEVLSGSERLEEYLMLRLRLLREGFDPAEGEFLFGEAFARLQKPLEGLIEAGDLVRESDGRIRLSEKSLPFANRVISSLF